MFKTVSDFFNNIGKAFSFAFSKRAQIEEAVEEIGKLTTDLNLVISSYKKATADNQITLAEAMQMLDKSKNLIDGLATTKQKFDKIFKD